MSLKGKKNYILSMVQAAGAAAFAGGLITPEQWQMTAAIVAALQGGAVTHKLVRDRGLGEAK